MPRSRSRSIRSRYWARMSRAATAPVSSRRRSASVDFPWSMWAMMQKLRISSGGVTGTELRGVSGTKACVAGWEGSSVRLSYEGPLVDSLADGQHQVPDQAQQDQRAPPRAQQGRALRAQDGGEEGAHRGGRLLAGAPRGLPRARQGGLGGSAPQADGRPTQVPARFLRERRRLSPPQAAVSAPAIPATSTGSTISSLAPDFSARSA